jgi:hypothetical protein
MNDEKNRSLERHSSTPRPTAVPAALAMSVTLLASGIVTHWSMSLVGVGLFVWALGSWMREICYQWGISDDA